MKLIILWSVIFLLYILCLCFKRRVSILSTLILTASITFFSLFTPNGKVLMELGQFHITLGAVQDGLLRSGILILLQLLSKIFISAKVRLPGKAGLFISEVFSVYEKLTGGESSAYSKIEVKNLMQSIDMRLCAVWDEIKKNM